jgi:antibiotic biosynthesis monooxygenase (ABM) superfamily enzyme
MIKHFQAVWLNKRRQVLIAWLAAWPTLTTVLFLTQPFSHDWPLPLRSLVSATAMVIMMNFVSVPVVATMLAKLVGFYRRNSANACSKAK